MGVKQVCSTTCVVVDDEPLCRKLLCHLLHQEFGLTVVADVGSVDAAVHCVRQLRPDVIFLDVQLGLESGFSVLSQLDVIPRVIFVTAYDHYAVRAFEVNAIDYLLKPVSILRLRKALGRLDVSSHGSSVGPLQMDDIALVPVGASGFFTPVRDILLVESDNHCSVLTLESGRKCTVRRSLRDWRSQLPVSVFFSLDRSCLINLQQIQNVEMSHQGGTVTLGDRRHQLLIGRAAARRLRALITTPTQPHLNSLQPYRVKG
jgi:two-component system LytT family response regulator